MIECAQMYRIGDICNNYMQGKGKKQKKQIQTQREPEDLPCQVCSSNRFGNDPFEKITCISCGAFAHKNCYAPDTKDKDKNKFKCDPCKKRIRNKDKQPPKQACSHCGSSKGILKEVSNAEYMHVLCALTSSRVILNDYQTLNFAAQGQVSSKKLGNKKKCSFCNYDYVSGISCRVKGCHANMHLNCVVNETDEGNDFISIMSAGLLDRNEGCLLYRLNKQYDLSQVLQQLPTEGKQPHYIVCEEHNNDENFVWCFCGTSHQISYHGCQTCKRWYHKTCLGEGVEICKGCTDNDIFVKYLTLPQLIVKAAEIERSQQLDKKDIKFLDHFCFRPSLHMEKQIKQKKNLFQIERFFLRKQLEKHNNKQPEDYEEEAHMIQILHYLLRRQIKKEPQITVQNIEQMLAELSGKGMKFQWSQKQDKPEKKFKKFLQDKLKKLQKDDVRQVRIKLIQFTKQQSHSSKSQKQIIANIYPILTLIEHSQTLSTALHKNSQNNNILQFLAESGLNQTQMVDVLKGLKKLIRAHNCKYIDQNDYFQITFKLYPQLTQNKSKVLKAIQSNLMKGVRQRKIYQFRRQILNDIQNNYQQAKSSQKKTLRNKAINNGVILPFGSNAFQFQTESIEFQICKRLFKTKYNPPNPSNISSGIGTIQKMLNLDLRVGILSKDERNMYLLNVEKYKFYQSLVIYQEQFLKKLAYQEIQSGVLQQACSPQQNCQQLAIKTIEQPNQQKLQQKLLEVLNQWPKTAQSVLFVLNSLKQVSIRKIEFTQNEKNILNVFFDTMVLYLQNFLSIGMLNLRIPIVKQITVIARHLSAEERYHNYIQIDEFYEKWKQQLQQRFSNIQKVLECPYKSSQLLNILDIKMSQISYRSLNFDFSVEIRKLKIMRMWALFSQKILVPDRKVTITAIQNVKSLMDKINYPANAVRKDIQKLDNQSRSLNKKIGRFLERNKITDMEFYEELKFMENKMSLQQAQQLRRDLQNSDLDVEIQLNELKEQIINSRQSTKDIEKYFREVRQSQLLANMRKQLLQGPFLMCTISQYQSLLRAYYSRKCDEYSGITTKKDYFRMLNYGGTSSIQLLNKTQPLFKMYKDIQAAQKQILNIKPKQQILLSYDLKKIKTDLHDDPSQSLRVQRYYTHANKLRVRFYALRQERADADKYIQLQDQLIRLPINNKDILLQIGRMRKEIQDIVNRARMCLPEHSQSQNISFQSPYATQLLYKYQNIGMRCEFMQKFEDIVTKAKQISDYFRNLNFQNYKPFSMLCTSLPQLEKNNQIYKQRQNAFDRIFQPFLDNSDPLIQVGCTLLAEGGFLAKRPIVAERVLPILMKINSKLIKMQRPMYNPERGAEEEESLEEQVSYDSDQYADDEQENLQDLQIDQENQLDNIDLQDQQIIESVNDEELDEIQYKEQNNQQNNKKLSKKRPRPKENSLVISDDEN